jgi:hypothetical protein
MGMSRRRGSAVAVVAILLVAVILIVGSAYWYSDMQAAKAKDMAGQGTYQKPTPGTTPFQITVTFVTVTQRNFSSTPVSATGYADPYFEETDTIHEETWACTFDGTFDQAGNPNNLVKVTLLNSKDETTLPYPVTPMMVYLDLKAKQAGRSPGIYPDYIVNYYEAKYPNIFNGLSLLNTLFSSISIVQGKVSPSDVITWEQVLR